MDKQTQRELERISREMPDNLRKQMTVMDLPDAFEYEMYDRAKWLSKNSDNAMTRRVAKNFVENNIPKAKERANMAISNEIELYYETKIQKGIKEGTIKPAKKDDNFFQMLNENRKRHGSRT